MLFKMQAKRRAKNQTAAKEGNMKHKCAVDATTIFYEKLQK